MDLSVSDCIYMSNYIGDAIDPYDQNTINRAFVKLQLPGIIPSHTQILLSTAQQIKVDPGMVGFIGLRSTWARLGFISPQTVADPGFEGHLTLEVFNASSNPIIIRPGDVIFHIIYVPGVNLAQYYGIYQGQTGITLPKALNEH